MGKWTSKEPWRPIAEFDHERWSTCLVRCRCEGRHRKQMRAIWTEIPTRGAGLARGWVLENNEVVGLYDVSEFKLIASLPFTKGDAALVADRNLEPVTTPIIERTT